MSLDSGSNGGGEGGVEGGPDAPPGCTVGQGPKESPACIEDSFAVFVSPTGDDNAKGTKAAPVRSIAKGVTLAAANKQPHVYACEGSYDTNVEITAPLAVFGGVTCGWAPSENVRPKLAPAKGIALRVTKVTGAVVIQGLDVVGSADANAPGDSAIAAFASESSNVAFRSVNLNAGAGTPGGNAGGRSNYSGATAAPGANAAGATAGAGPSSTCLDGTTSKGGNGAAGNGADVSIGASTPPVGGPNSGSSNVAMCMDGQAGANGLPRAGGPPSTQPGSLSAAGWDARTTAASATNGDPAQGGG